MSWQWGLLANGVIAAAYYAIAWTILRPLAQIWGRTVRDETYWISGFTGLIFLSSAGGHMLDVWHLAGVLEPAPTVTAARAAADIHMSTADSVTAVIAIIYWVLRIRNRGRVTLRRPTPD